jgi:PAS domain S-box-containing protein
MIAPPVADNEDERLRALHGLGLLDSEPEERFDRLTRLAKATFGTPFALISLVDADRQWFKSNQGFQATHTSREVSFCGHGIAAADVMVVRDAPGDPRFADNPLVTGGPKIRFYAGAPLAADNGSRIGTLCVIDSERRDWSNEDSRTLRDLADLVEEEFRRVATENQQRAVLALTAITALSDADPRDSLRRALRLGCDYLGLSQGVVSRIEGTDVEVLVQVSAGDSLRDGQHVSIDETLCALTLGAADVLAIHSVSRSSYAHDPAMRAAGIEAHIGVTLEVAGTRYGTLSFASCDTRSAGEFSDADIAFMRLLGRWVAAVIRRIQLATDLAVQQEMAAIVTRAQSSFIEVVDRRATFNGLLEDILRVTGCEYGFIGEVLSRPTGTPFLRTLALTNIAWNDAIEASFAQHLEEGLEFDNPETLFGHTLTTGAVVMSNDPAADPRAGGLPAGHPALASYLGVPVMRDGMVGMIGLANRTGGFTDQDIAFLQPILVTCGQMIEVWQETRDRREDRRTLARLSTVASQMPSGVIITGVDGHIEWNNDAFSRMTGFPPADLIGTRPRDLLHGPASDPATINSVFAAMSRREAFDVELLAYPRAGPAFWVKLNADPLVDENGEPEGYMVMVADISDRMRIERMKREFVSTVSHELRTPLTSITGSLSLVAAGVAGDLPEGAHRMIGIAQKNSERLGRLIDDLLDMEKLVEGKVRLDMQVCALVPVVERSLEENKGYADGFGVAYAFSQDCGPVLVDVDPHRLQQVLTNLLSNAAKFSSHGSTVEVQVTRDGFRVRVEVRDHGRGIPYEFQGRIFEKFSQADSSDSREFGGTGLGLAISRELIHRMGGIIGFTSAEGVGSAFYFDLPVSTMRDPASTTARRHTES